MTDTQTRPTPSPERAAGMLKALTATHRCGEACTGMGTVGGQPRPLRCPYGLLDPTRAADARTIQTLYVDAVRAAR